MTTLLEPAIGSGIITRQDGPVIRVTADVAQLETVMVNLFFVGPPGAQSGEWTLIDTGLPFSSGKILKAAESLFGAGSKPGAIVLTHGHFDHVGTVRELAERWNVPVYAHPLELPYLAGQSSYPPPDPTVGGGMMARLSMLYPKKPIDLGGRVRALPEDGTVPNMPGWRWLPTPGHSPGHISLFRESDRLLIAGDAIVTQKQESLTGVISKHPILRGPPMYFTPDWESARASVKRLAQLEPNIAATGHGYPMFGARLDDDLRTLADRFNEMSCPSHGRYVDDPAITDESGVVYVPPRPFDPVTTIAVAALVATAVGLVVSHKKKEDA